MDKVLSGQIRLKTIRTYKHGGNWFQPPKKKLVKEFHIIQVQLASGEWVNAFDNPLNIVEDEWNG